MDPADVTAFGGKPEGFGAHLKMRRGFGQVADHWIFPSCGGR